ncbi:class I adenylate-forming enzyme family protein [Pseudooceanicola sp. C21-150M6]|uniref:class I adenylate-forming enzyme family protein n=1 Tax=Pseudooceanicola sp. C21-150M6 TaxID=3434355 RepID=UPI003D7F943A
MSQGVDRVIPKPIEDEELLKFAPKIRENFVTYAEKTCVVDEVETLSWAEFGGLVMRVAGRLKSLGIGPGSMVASLSENTAMNLVLYAGVLYAGACMVPLPFSATEAALVKMRSDCGATLLFASPKFRDTADKLGASDIVDLTKLRDWIGDADPIEPVDVEFSDLFDMIYSSGTTGTPKGIIHDHLFRSRQFSRSSSYGMDETGVMMMSTPLYSNTTLVAVIAALVKGATVVSMERFNTVRFLELSEKHRATHAMLVPVQYMRLMDEPRFDEFDLSSYQCKMSTSAPLPGLVIEKVMKRWPGNVMEFYGMTEGGPATVLDCAAHPDKWDTVGQPQPGADMRVIDEDGNELPYGSYGEVVGRSGAMMPGYHNAPEKTKEATWVSPDGLHFVRTGDMGRFDDDGFLHLLDRKKDMIISGGFNIYAADLEAVLRKHPDVADVAVIAIPSRDWGETPLGLVVPARPEADSEEIRDWANAQLGKTQRVSKVEFRDDLPRSEIGKILKRELREPYWEGQTA